MHRPFRSLAILAVAVAVALAAASYVVDVAIHARSVATSIWEYGRDLARGILAGPVPMASVNAPQQQVVRVRAQAFAGGMLKRERPRVFSTWRMCPSI